MHEKASNGKPGPELLELLRRVTSCSGTSEREPRAVLGSLSQLVFSVLKAKPREHHFRICVVIV